MIPLLFALLTNCPPAPVREFPAHGAMARLAIFLSGDGGWRPVDRKITTVLTKNGVAVVGFVTPPYYATRRTAETSACSLADLIRAYQQRWNKQKFILIGFSRGADVLPFMINRLPPDLRSSIDLVALLGPEPTINFEYHPFWSILRYVRHPPLFEVQPEIESLRGLNVLCVYGEREKDSLCPTLDPSQFRILREKGGHHYAGRYDEVAHAILDAAP
ncbi:MAG TPA: AcvB/VirJ family lysyl-phosphatidylglycerol hydrolase [Thermoanaerobaculia bacterium]|nr:AcvB/VirJ family lysyl-phosphatidylglycerol hydrolase [Thermoanaerobaculia bacterium]